MGGKTIEAAPFNREEYVKHSSRGNYEVLSKANSSQPSLQEYTRRYLEEKEFTKDMQLFEERVKSHPNVVKFVAANVTEGGSCSCGNMTVAKVVTEHIPVLLSELSNIPEEEAFGYLADATKGYEAIAKTTDKGFVVDNNMMGLDTKNKLKVWLNRDFSKNEPDPTRSADDKEHLILSSLFNSFETLFPGKEFPSYFQQERSRLRTPYSFASVKPMVEQFSKRLPSLRSVPPSFPAPLQSLPKQSTFRSGLIPIHSANSTIIPSAPLAYQRTPTKQASMLPLQSRPAPAPVSQYFASKSGLTGLTPIGRIQ